MTLMLAFELQGLPPISTNGPQGMTKGGRMARASARAKWKRLAVGAILNCPMYSQSWPMLKKASLVLIRRSSMTADADNGVASFKPIVDALVHCKVIEDDRWDVIGQPKYLPEKAKKGQGSVRVEVWA